MDKKIIGANIRAVRKLQGITIQTLAEVADISVHFTSQIERGEAVASLKTMLKIANALEINMDYILGDNLLVNTDFENAAIKRIKSELSDLSENQQKSILKIIREIKKI